MSLGDDYVEENERGVVKKRENKRSCRNCCYYEPVGITILNGMMTMRKHKERLDKRSFRNYCCYKPFVLLVVGILIITLKKDKMRILGSDQRIVMLVIMIVIVMMTLRKHKKGGVG